MSWFSENYEKVVLGGAAIIALGFGYSALSSGDDPYAVKPVNANEDVDVNGMAKIAAVKESLAVPHGVIDADVDGRKVELFTGVPLFSKKDDPGNPVDLLKSDAVHPGIENIWWLRYGFDPGYSDSPDRDPDKDGFSNREEYMANTDPSDFNDHPNPISKLKLLKVKTTQVHIKPQDFGKGLYMFKLQNKRGADLNRMSQTSPKPIGAGVLIPFERPLMKERFKLVDVEQREVDKGGIKQKVKVWIIEDRQPNKKGQKHEFDSRGNLFGLKNRSRGIMDSTAEFILDALGQAGNPFRVVENTRFSLPFNADSRKKPYLLKSVDLNNKTLEVEYTDKNGVLQNKTMSFK